MKLLKYLLGLTLIATTSIGANIDYRALRTNQFSTNIPSAGYVGIIGYGVTNIPGTNVQFNSGTGITFTTNGAAITITATGTNQANVTNVIVRAGTNVVVETNAPTDWTINATAQDLWRTNAEIGGMTNTTSPVKVSTKLIVSGQLQWTNGLLSSTNYWDGHLTGSKLVLFGDGPALFSFDTNGIFSASNFQTPSNVPTADYVLTSSGGALGGGVSRWAPAGAGSNSVAVAAGTNIFMVTNAGLVTVSVANTNLPVVVAGSNITVATNGIAYTVSGAGGSSVVVAGTNVTVQTNGNAYTVNSTGGGTASIGPGTINQVAKFTSTTNVGDSIVSETATNQWEWRSRLSPNAWTNNITNAIYGRDSGAGSWDRLELVSASGLGNGYNELNGRTTLSAPNGNAPLKIFDTMIINHGVTSASGNPAGAVGPVQDNFSTFGTSSGRWKSIWVGPDGYRMTDAVDISTPNLTATTYSINLFSGGIEMFKNSFGFIGGFWRDPNLLGGMVLPAAGVIGAGSGNFVWDTFMKRGNEAHTWMFQTNNNSASAPPAAVLEGSEGTGTDGAGGVMRIASGRGTGNGIAPNLYFATPITNGGSGSGIQTLVDRMQINGTNGNVIIYSNLTVNGSFSAGSLVDPNALTNNDTRNITFTGSFSDTRNGVSTVIDSNTITSGMLTLSGSGTNYFGANVNVNGTVNATGYTNSGLTASRLMLTDANKAQASAAASGAVPVDADGSAATFAQVSALAPGYAVTNGNANALSQSNDFTAVSGTRQFIHNSTHTLITNTATLTASEWTAGSQKEWYNGATTMTIDKTNGAITMNGALSTLTNLQATANFNRLWALTNPAASYTQAAPIGVDAGATLFQQTLYTITNNSGSAITVTLPGGLKKATWWGTNVTAFYVTNATMQWWTCRPGETNVYIEGGY